MNMTDVDLYCAINRDGSREYACGPHECIDKAVFVDAYLVSDEISQRIPSNKYLIESDLRDIGFVLDLSGEYITVRDNIPESNELLDRFPYLNCAVSEYIQDLDSVPTRRLRCPYCHRNVVRKQKIQTKIY